MGIALIQAKSVLQKSGIPGIAYVINPYTGCTHGCVYCYARFMRRFTGHEEAWGTFIDVKENAPELLRKQLKRRKEPLTDEVFLSSVTDPYMPIESKYRLTRQILEVLAEYRVPISILTKSDVVLRDLDLLKRFERCSVGFSIMTTDDEIARHFEPFAAPPSRRIQALKTLKEQGIRTYAFISPYLPALSQIETIMNALNGLVDEVGVETLNIRGGNWQGVRHVIEQNYPNLLPGYEQRVKDMAYWEVIERQARELAAAFNIDFMGFFRH